jgi:hypothetical protein
MSDLQYFPAAIFRDRDANCEILSFQTVQAASTSATWIAAVAGKRIRVLSFLCVSDAAATVNINVYSNAAGTIVGRAIAPNNTLGQMFKLDFNPAGWYETNTGELLGGTTAAGGQAILCFRYIIYTP